MRDTILRLEASRDHILSLITAKELSEPSLHTEEDMMAVIRQYKKAFDKSRKSKGLPRVFYE